MASNDAEGNMTGYGWSVRLQFDRATSIRRPTLRPLRYVTTVGGPFVGCCTAAYVYVTAASGLRHSL